MLALRVTCKVSAKAAASGVMDLAAPPAGLQKFICEGYFFFLPDVFERGGPGVFQGQEKELQFDIMEPLEVSQLTAQESRLLRQETETKSRELVGHGTSLNFLTVSAAGSLLLGSY